MADDNEELKVGSAVPLFAGIAAAVAVLVLVIGFFVYRSLASEAVYGEVVIATGPETGTYYRLGQALKRVMERTGRFSAVELRVTDGSFENMALVQSDESIDLAFVQAETTAGSNARLLTELYDEVLHVLISADNAEQIKTIYDLEGRRVSFGAEGSGTRDLSRRVFEHMGIVPSEDLILSPLDAIEALQSGSLDAVFVLSALPSPLIYDLAKKDAVRFVPIGDMVGEGDEAHALELLFPGVKRQLIPRSAYRRLPVQAIGTVAVPAMLIGRETLDDAMVREITELVFSYRAGDFVLEGQELAITRQISERYDPAESTIPYHPGAVAYFTREQPPFFVEYAEALSLGVTLLLGIYSVFIAFRELLRRRMKNRVDAYLVQVESLVEGLEQLDLKGLRERCAALDQLRHTAISDLVEERLQADDAYLIMQQHVSEELQHLRRHIALREAAG